MSEQVDALGTQHVDVLIVGAGVSGIGTACHLTRKCPEKSYLVLERRPRSAAPGTCSATPASARTRTCSPSAITSAPGPRRRYSPTGHRSARTSSETAREYGVLQHIRFGHRVVRADWSSAEPAGGGGGPRGHRPDRDGDRRLPGRLHRLLQLRRRLPAEVRRRRALHRAGRPSAALARGSRLRRQAGGGHRQRRHCSHPGAGAGPRRRARHDAAALPELHLSLPADDKIAEACAKCCPSESSTRWHRSRNVALQRGLYRWPGGVPRWSARWCSPACAARWGPTSTYAHFTPRYDPWDQRCA